MHAYLCLRDSRRPGGGLDMAKRRREGLEQKCIQNESLKGGDKRLGHRAGGEHSPGRHEAPEPGRLVGVRTVGRAEAASVFAGFGRTDRMNQTRRSNGSD